MEASRAGIPWILFLGHGVAKIDDQRLSGYPMQNDANEHCCRDWECHHNDIDLFGIDMPDHGTAPSAQLLQRSGRAIARKYFPLKLRCFSASRANARLTAGFVSGLLSLPRPLGPPHCVSSPGAPCRHRAANRAPAMLHEFRDAMNTAAADKRGKLERDQ